MGEWERPKSDGDVLYASEFNATAPIGVIMPWLKSYTNTPALPEGWVECDGSTLSDADSVYDGQVIPDLNGDNRFLRGNSTSGGTGGTENHTHTNSSTLQVRDEGTLIGYATTGVNSTSTLPTYYEVVWIMKIK